MTNPFVGLRPFALSEGHLFFGREREIGVVLNLIATLPVLIVYARSGTGKSSLLNAGVGPELVKDPTQVPIYVDTTVTDIAGVVRAELSRSGWAADDSISLHATLQRHWTDTDKRTVIILDQFEERLNSGMEHSELYAAIARLVNESSDAACVVISIREDYLGELEPLIRTVPSLLNASYRVPTLSREALEAAIYGPLLYDENTTVENALVDVTIKDLHQRQDQSGLPGEQAFEPGYFQIVWSTLWESGHESRHGRLTVGLYRDLGGSATILKSFTTARLGELEPAEAQLFWAMSRYLVLPTGAKVALTVEDLILLQKESDYLTPSGTAGYVSSGGFVWVAYLSPEALSILARRVFQKLTSSQSPLFQRMMRSGREEFELLHDLLAGIILEWRTDFEKSFRREYDAQLTAIRKKTKKTSRGLRSYVQVDAAEGASNSRSLDEADDDDDIGSGAKIANIDKFRSLVRDYSRRGTSFAQEMADSVHTGSEALLADFAQLSEELLAVNQLAEGTIADAEAYSQTNITRHKWEKARDKIVPSMRYLALEHPSSNMRRVAQIQLFYWSAGRLFAIQALRQERQRPANMAAILRRSSALVGAAALLGFCPLLLVNWLILYLFPQLHLQYTWLSIVIIASAASIVYGIVIDETMESSLFKAILETCFPSLADHSQEYPRSIFLTWWPLPLVTISVFSAAGAWLFQAAGFSPTAGFNIGILAGSAAVIGALVMASG
jgi:hypothetical protein